MIFTNADGSVSDERSLDIEQMIDDTDLSTPLEPLADCFGTCIRGAVAISNDGATGSAWNYPTWEIARDSAVNSCVAGTSMPCLAWATVSGTEWASAVYCEVTSPEGYTLLQQGFTGQGNDLGASIRNAFRNAVSTGTFTLDQCALKAYVAADGAHTTIGQPIPEPAPVVAENPAPPQAPVIEARSVAENLPGEGFYSYNGSTFYTQKIGDKTAFYYNDPRKALFKVGIKHGSLLFEGTLKGSVFTGYGITYLHDCPAIKYDMTGTLSNDGLTISLAGTQPSRDKQCR